MASFPDRLRRLEQSPVAAVAALAAAAGIAASQLNVRSTWGDEICSLYAVTRPGLAETWKFIVNDVHPPLYFLLLKAWVAVFGGSLESARAFSILAIVGGLGIVWLTARRYFTAAAGLWSVIFFGLAPFLIYHSVHARMYGLLFCFAALFLSAGLRARESGRPRDFARLALAGLALLYTQYVGIFLVAGTLLAAAALDVRRRRWLAGWLASGAAIAALFAPWLPFFRRQTSTAMITEGAARFTFGLRHLKYFAKIASPFDHIVWPPLVVIGGAAAALLVVGGAVRIATGDRRDSGRWLVAVTTASIGLFLAAATVKPLIVTRTMIWFLPSFALFAGVALADLPVRARLLGAAYLVVVWVAFLPDLSLYRRHTDWRAAVNYLAENFAPDDVLVLDRSITFCETVVLDYYLERSPARDRIVWGRNLYLPRPGEPQVPGLPPNPRRRWFFLEPAERPAPGLHHPRQDEGFVMQDRRTWFEVGLTRYDPPERVLSRGPDGALLAGTGP